MAGGSGCAEGRAGNGLPARSLHQGEAADCIQSIKIENNLLNAEDFFTLLCFSCSGMCLECALPEGGIFSDLLAGSDTVAVTFLCVSVALWLDGCQQMV